MGGHPAPAGNPIGWLFLVTGVCMFLCTVGGDYGDATASGSGTTFPWARWDRRWPNSGARACCCSRSPILLFPDGRLPSRLWRSVLAGLCVSFALLLVATGVATAGALAAHPVRVDDNGGLAAVDQPVGWFNAVQGPLIVVMIGLSLAFIARQALSWRRATGERRQQLKWLASGAAVSIVCLILAANSGSSGTTAPRSGACSPASRGSVSPRCRCRSGWRS